MHEASLHDRNCFLTLTYGEDAPLSLRYRDVQLFWKRLRAWSKAKLRYYCGGEYGEENYRPHYHACVFGFGFDDLTYWGKSPSGSRLYRSARLERLWPHGFSSVGALTFESAAYVARYCMKKMTGDGDQKYYNVIDPDTGEIFPREKENARMSKGIGADWLRLYWPEVARTGKVVARGHEAEAPRFYMKRLRKLSAMEEIELRRHQVAVLQAADRTDERLAVREAVTKARSNLLKRGKV